MRNTIIGLVLWVFCAGHAPAQSADYEDCTRKVSSEPSVALRLAERWIQTENHPSAYHCRALALFALKRYPESAKALEELSTKIGEKNLVLWGNVIRQAARSWELAEDKAKAIVALTKGISRTANLGLSEPVVGQLSAELLLERSQLYASGGRELFALQDLDQAISLSPENAKLYLARAELFVAQNEKVLARRDLEVVKGINADYPGLKELLKRAR